jgi:hypothetical protein
MKDPLAPENAYNFFHLSGDETPGEIDEAFDRFIESNPGRESEAIPMWDELRHPQRRLSLDIFQYQVKIEDRVDMNFAFELPQLNIEDIARVEQLLLKKINEKAGKIDFGPAKNILDLDIKS